METTKAVRLCVVLMALICSPGVPGIHGSIRSAPRNQIVTAGSDVTFTCSSDIINKTITWIYKPPYKLMSASTFPLTMSNGTQIRNAFLGKVNVTFQNYTDNDREEVVYKLTIKNVKFANAGLYTCQDNNGYGQPVRGALLAVLDQPTCHLDRNDTKSSNNVTIHCNVSYCGNFTFNINLTPPRQTDSTCVLSVPKNHPATTFPKELSKLSDNITSRTETIVNDFTTTIYTHYTSVTMAPFNNSYVCHFTVTPGPPQILSDTIDHSVPSFDASVTSITVNISNPVISCDTDSHTVNPTSATNHGTSSGINPTTNSATAARAGNFIGLIYLFLFLQLAQAFSITTRTIDS